MELGERSQHVEEVTPVHDYEMAVAEESLAFLFYSPECRKDRTARQQAVQR